MVSSVKLSSSLSQGLVSPLSSPRRSVRERSTSWNRTAARIADQIPAMKSSPPKPKPKPFLLSTVAPFKGAQKRSEFGNAVKCAMSLGAPIATPLTGGSRRGNVSVVGCPELPEGCVFDSFESPIGGIMLLASPLGLHALLLSTDDGSMSKEQRAVEENVTRTGGSDAVINQAKVELQEYFKGERKSFSLPLAPLGGTPFQRLVWMGLDSIPYGHTISYSEQAANLGLSGTSSRAVGTANGKNPLPIVLPCHRVIGKSGALTGYAGGLKKKKFLLQLESS